MELLVVLGILGAIGSIVIATISSGIKVADGTGESLTAQEIATRASFREVEKALLGDPENPGYFTHTLSLPSRIVGLFENVDGEPSFNLATGNGWNGPYLISNIARYGNFIESGDGFDDNTDLTGIEDDPAVLDAWGKPIVLQEPDTTDARLVSAGPNRILEMDPNDAMDAGGDDLVRFLRSVDPRL